MFCVKDEKNAKNKPEYEVTGQAYDTSKSLRP